MGRREAPGSDLLTEQRRLLRDGGEHAKQLDAGMPDDLLMAPLRRHVEGLLGILRELWAHGDAWEKDRDSLIDILGDDDGPRASRAAACQRCGERCDYCSHQSAEQLVAEGIAA
jgi:hypothetical protein